MYSGRPGHRALIDHVESVHVKDRARFSGEVVTFPCNLGGVREYLVCPRCGKRFVILYRVADVWGCRKCLKLAYMSENSDKAQRLWLQKAKGKRVVRRLKQLANR